MVLMRDVRSHHPDARVAVVYEDDGYGCVPPRASGLESNHEPL